MFHVHDNASEWLNTQCEEEIQRITDQVYSETKKLIYSNKKKVKVLAEAILEYETISGQEVREVLEKGRKEAVQKLRLKNKEIQEERRKKIKENQFVDLEK